MVTYTTAAKVKSRIEDYDTTVTDNEINEYILCAEGIIDGVMRATARGTNADFTFDASKHGLIEEAASCMAAFSVLTRQPTGQSGNISSARAGLMGDFLWSNSRRALKLLSDSRVVEFLKGL